MRVQCSGTTTGWSSSTASDVTRSADASTPTEAGLLLVGAEASPPTGAETLFVAAEASAQTFRRTEDTVPSMPRTGTFCVQSSEVAARRDSPAGAEVSDFRTQGRKRKRLLADESGTAKIFPDCHWPALVQPGRNPLTVTTDVADRKTTTSRNGDHEEDRLGVSKI